MNTLVVKDSNITIDVVITAEPIENKGLVEEENSLKFKKHSCEESCDYLSRGSFVLFKLISLPDINIKNDDSCYDLKKYIDDQIKETKNKIERSLSSLYVKLGDNESELNQEVFCLNYIYDLDEYLEELNENIFEVIYSSCTSTDVEIRVSVKTKDNCSTYKESFKMSLYDLRSCFG